MPLGQVGNEVRHRPFGAAWHSHSGDYAENAHAILSRGPKIHLAAAFKSGKAVKPAGPKDVLINLMMVSL